MLCECETLERWCQRKPDVCGCAPVWGIAKEIRKELEERKGETGEGPGAEIGPVQSRKSAMQRHRNHVFGIRASRSSTDACHLRPPGTDRGSRLYCIVIVNINGTLYTSGGSDSVHKCGLEMWKDWRKIRATTRDEERQRRLAMPLLNDLFQTFDQCPSQHSAQNKNAQKWQDNCLQSWCRGLEVIPFQKKCHNYPCHTNNDIEACKKI